MELKSVRDSHERPYMREKASALLKIASGQSPHAVALAGLLKRRRPDTIYGWFDRYKADGIKGLLVKKGRGMFIRPAWLSIHAITGLFEGGYEFTVTYNWFTG